VNSKVPETPGYRLEHRLTGAAILFAFAILVIPLLLKEPGVGVNARSTIQANNSYKTFKSKIEQPLNLSDVINNGTIAALESEYDIESSLDKNKELSKGSKNVETDSGNNISKSKTALVMIADKKSEYNQAKIQQQRSQSLEVQEIAKENSEQQKAHTTTAGEWAVRVGTFSKQANVASVNHLLNSNGFSPRITKINTRLGKATRIWLGPYENKEKAEKVSASLQALIGERGYVIKHMF